MVRGKGKTSGCMTPGQAVTRRRRNTYQRDANGIAEPWQAIHQWAAAGGLMEVPFPRALSLFSIDSSIIGLYCTVVPYREWGSLPGWASA